MRFQKPTPEEVTKYAYKIGFILNGEEFCDYYESKGWMVGKSPMKVWMAAVRTWKNKDSRWTKEKIKVEIPADNDKLIRAKERMEAIKEREWQRKELIRLAQERDDRRSKKMFDAAGDTDWEPPKDEISEQERIYSNGE